MLRTASVVMYQLRYFIKYGSNIALLLCHFLDEKKIVFSVVLDRIMVPKGCSHPNPQTL